MSRSYINQYLDPPTRVRGDSNKRSIGDDQDPTRRDDASFSAAAAPSALRRGKYSQFPQSPPPPPARSDLGFRASETSTTRYVADNGRGYDGRDCFQSGESDIDLRTIQKGRTGSKKKKEKGSANDGENICDGGETGYGKHSMTTRQPLTQLSGPATTPQSSSAVVGFGASGHILSRTSSTSLLLRRWKESYWVHLPPARILLFRSEEEFAQWKAKSGAVAHLVRATDALRDKLVRWAVDFDTMGVLRKKRQKRKKKEFNEMRGDIDSKGDGKDNKESAIVKEATTPAAPTVQGVHMYYMANVHSKKYDRNGPVLHGFKIEHWTQTGTKVSAAFASADPHETKALRKVIRGCVELVSPGSAESRRKKPNKSLKKPHSEISTRDTSVMSGMTGMSYGNRNEEFAIAGETAEDHVAISEIAGSSITGASTTLFEEDDGGSVRLRRGRRRRHGRPTPSIVSAF